MSGHDDRAAEIVLDRVSLRHRDGTEALREVSLTARAGEILALVGPSGSGKSSLLSVVAGLERPTAGEIRIDGAPVSGVDPRDRNLAMVFQSYALYPHRTVRGNLSFPLEMARLDQREIARRTAEAAQLLGISHLLDRRPGELSGGERQRVAMGRALVRRPAAFLMDEPLSNLDVELRLRMRGEIARLQRRLGTTTLYVTHDQGEALTLGDRVGVLRDGRLLQVEPPRELYLRPAELFVARFIGSPPMNLFPARLEHSPAGDELALPFARVSIPSGTAQRLAGRELLAGLRPEHLRVRKEGADTAEDAVTVRGRLERLEWLGAEATAEVTLEGSRRSEGPSDDDVRARARLDPERPAEPGELLALSFEPRHLHLFDAESERRLASAAGGS